MRPTTLKSKAFKSAIPEGVTEPYDEVIPLIRADVVRSVLTAFEKHGVDIDDALQHVNISREMLLDSNNMIMNESVRCIFEIVYNQNGIWPFVNGIQETLKTHLIPEFVKSLSHSLTIRDVLTKFNLLIRETIPVASQYLDVEHDTAWFCSAYKHKNIGHWQEVFNILYCTQLIRALTSNQNWKPRKVSLQQGINGDFAKNIPSDVQLFFSQKVTKISVELELLDQLIDTPYPEPEPREIVWHSTFTDTLYTTLLPYVHEQNLDIELAATLFDMSSRTLQRRLQQEKNSFRAIKNSLMFDTACELMSRNLSLTQVSVQLGYADISHFSRAFKRFSGLTPKLYQAALIEEKNSLKIKQS
ncbi:hypothetical protein BCS96_11310 [Vibrio breoganii]|uniref:AraC family transcriptional regulator n=1 Tax=Vibrio breoganii TaxID=553239 RepID=A0AAP8MU09_9VIBR|nr:AraC family transcriptional regulator [Vibrio breoganii]NMR71875.1 AraC family transcriptional regulator [Vibrio breoganii]PMF98836.1 hypothetical protein BCV02_16725 [Vibrio breoganii]PMG91666.1 hypothetical protein BCU81_04895 [Vibrio breoganii]PMG94594.1 hypothetical protein BCU80_06615 [Vibrio breoganii]